MTVQKLQTKLRRHNMLQIGVGATLALTSAALWFGSFWAVRWMYYFIASAVGFQGAWYISLYVAWSFTALLALEGLRRSRPLFDLLEYAQSDFNWYGRRDGSVAANYARYRGDPMASAWLLTELLLLAPRSTVLAIESLRAIVRAPPAAVDQATAIFNALKADHRWHSAEDFGDCGPALRVLVRLRLIWMQKGVHGLEVRFPAAATEAELV